MCDIWVIVFDNDIIFTKFTQLIRSTKVDIGFYILKK